MDAPVQKQEHAWQPLTPRGVAAFGQARYGRLLVVQFVVALLAAASVVWVVQKDWFRSVQDAIQNLPRSGEIRSARLRWDGSEPQCLAESRFLSIAVDLRHQGQVRSPAHLQLEFGDRDLQVASLFGFIRFAYPRTAAMAFNRPQLEPWWGAWAPPILALTAGAVVLLLLLAWTALSLIYMPLVWLVAFYGNRNLTLRQSRRVAGAALMPGALFLSAAIVIYGLGAMDLVQLLAAIAAHFVIGWVYLVVSPPALRRDPKLASAKSNPFRQPQTRP